MLDAARLREILRYSPQTGGFIWLKPSPFHAEKRLQSAGTITPGHSGKSYWNISIDGRKYKRSRLAWLYMMGAWPTHQIDHADGNSLNDAWENLREATPTQNAWNHKRRAKRSDLPMGVRRNAGGSYSARLAVNKQMLHLGAFETPELAAEAYQKARERHYGEFA